MTVRFEVSDASSEHRLGPHICVCVATFRRPALLDACLAGLTAQFAREFSYSIVVVDNDPYASGQDVVRRWQRDESSPVISYAKEPEPNIAIARNRAVQAAAGEYIAFIDDDEVPGKDWLARLFATQRRFGADGVLGPVLPRFTGDPPRWLVESRLCDRPRFVTGTWLSDPIFLRTGNVLLGSRLLGEDKPFDPRLGRTGGEDTDFFARKLAEGYTFVWCDEASVDEWVPRERQTLRFFVRRGFVLGATAADREGLISWGTLKSIMASVIYSAALPIAALVSRARAAALLVKLSNHVAKLLAHLGVRPFRIRALDSGVKPCP